jgi:hypothetical protein
VQRQNALIPVSVDQLQVILGSALGDGSFEKTPKSPTYALAIKHGLKQKNYCLWKAHILSELITKVDFPKDRVRARTIRHPIITDIAKVCLLPGRKRITEKLLQKLGPLGCAIWYLDDGSLSRAKTSKTGISYPIIIRISTCAFTQEENKFLRSFLEKKLSVHTFRCMWVSKKDFNGKMYDTPRKYHGIGLRGGNALRFLQYITPVLKDQNHGMEYKLL